MRKNSWEKIQLRWFRLNYSIVPTCKISMQKRFHAEIAAESCRQFVNVKPNTTFFQGDPFCWGSGCSSDWTWSRNYEKSDAHIFSRSLLDKNCCVARNTVKFKAACFASCWLSKDFTALFLPLVANMVSPSKSCKLAREILCPGLVLLCFDISILSCAVR